MRFMTGDPEIPVLVRLTRNLLAVQAVVFFFGLTVYGLTALLASAGSTSITTASISSGGEVTLIAVGLLAFGAGAYLMGRLHPLARWIAMGLQLVWFGGLVAPGIRDNPVGEIIPVALGIAVVSLLFMPEVVRTFDPRIAARPVETPPAEVPSGVMPDRTSGVGEAQPDLVVDADSGLALPEVGGAPPEDPTPAA